MTKIQIINRLWSHVNDLLLLHRGQGKKTLEQIEQEIDVTEYGCRPYADADDDELYALDVMRTAKRMTEYQSGRSDGKGGL